MSYYEKHDYEPSGGERLKDAALELCFIARAKKAPATMVFNRITLTATETSVPEDIDRDYDQQRAARTAAYAASPEGIAAAAMRALDIEMAQDKTNKLTAELATLKLTEAAALRWLMKFTEAASHTEVKKDGAFILAEFAKLGWLPNACVGHPDVLTSKRVFARWLIGQALAGIDKHGVPHDGLMERFYEDYRSMR